MTAGRHRQHHALARMTIDVACSKRLHIYIYIQNKRIFFYEIYQSCTKGVQNWENYTNQL